MMSIRNKFLIQFSILTFLLLILFLYLNFSETQPYKCLNCNVIFVVFDGLQASHLNVYEYPKNTTSNIDRFAREGYLFKNAFSTASWTVPSHMSWFTSLYPSQHKIVNKFSVYNPPLTVISNLKNQTPDAVTLAEVLKVNGYQTAGFTGDAGVKSIFGFGQGFDIYLDDLLFGGFNHSNPAALTWLKNYSQQKFFLFLHGYDVHGQHDPAGGFTKKYVDFNYTGPLKGGKEEQGKLRELGLAQGYLNLTDDDVRFWRALYDEKINDVDREFGDFISEVQKMGLLNNTIVIISSDHGTEFYEHKRFDHGHTLYNELIHIPLIIWIPNSKGRIIDDYVSGIDLMPTVLDLLGIRNETAEKQMKGISLIPAIRGKTISRDVFSETDYRLYTHKRGMITKEGWKFIYTFAEYKKNESYKELYDLNNDPNELMNIIDKEPRVAYELEQKLFNHLTEINMSMVDPWELGCSPAYLDQCK